MTAKMLRLLAVSVGDTIVGYGRVTDEQLPEAALYQIFSGLPLHQIVICRCVCKFFNQFLTSHHFINLISTKPSLYLLAVRSLHNCHLNHSSPFNVFDLDQKRWSSSASIFFHFGHHTQLPPHTDLCIFGLTRLTLPCQKNCWWFVTL